MKNYASYHAGIKHTPYTGVFGTEPKFGPTSSSVPAEIIQCLETKDDLLTALSVPPNSADDVYHHPSLMNSFQPLSLMKPGFRSLATLKPRL